MKPAFYCFNLIKIAIPNNISRTPTTIKQILKIFVNSKSNAEVVTVEDKVDVVATEEVLDDVFVDDVFVDDVLLVLFVALVVLRSISNAAKTGEILEINNKDIIIIKKVFVTFAIYVTS